jgi:hypothetical protein
MLTNQVDPSWSKDHKGLGFKMALEGLGNL